MAHITPMNNIPIETAKTFFSYDPDTGEIRYRLRRGKCVVGTIIKCRTDSGHIVFGFERKHIRVHRLAWALTTGEWPVHEVDHINGDASDNRWCNLRQATHAENMKNMKVPRTNKTGFKGVSWDSQSRCFQAHIKANGVNYRLGRYRKAEDAHEAYKAASLRLHGEFGNHG